MTFETNKPVVHYSNVRFVTKNDVPCFAFVQTIDHPNLENGPETLAKTSEIVNYDETTGIFETKNTVYVPEGA